MADPVVSMTIGEMEQPATIHRLRAYVAEVWAYRYFWLSLVRIDLRNRYQRSVLGIGWTLLHPLAMTTVLCFCFHAIFKIDLAEYVPFLMTGVAFWAFTSGAVTEGGQTFFQAQGFIRSERVPVAVYPLRSVLGLMLHFCIVLSLAIVMAGVFKGYDRVLPLLSLFPTLVLLFLLGWSTSIIMAFACVHFPDMQHLATIGLQILFYLTPIMYPPTVAGSRWFGPVLRYNPLGHVAQLIRDPIVYSQWPSASAYMISLSLAVVTWTIAAFTLHRFERRLVFLLG